MNVRKLVDELVKISKDPNGGVTITRKYGDGDDRIITFEFANDGYYYPPGILRIQLQRDGAGVIYIYTTEDKNPHLTIPFDGPVHWTPKGSDIPECITRFCAIFS